MTELHPQTPLIRSAQRTGDVVSAAIHGEINMHNSPELREAVLNVLLTNTPKKLILDLAQVPYMDSSALAVLVEALQRLRKSAGQIILLRPQPRVRGLLEIARLDTLFTVVTDPHQIPEK